MKKVLIALIIVIILIFVVRRFEGSSPASVPSPVASDTTTGSASSSTPGIAGLIFAPAGIEDQITGVAVASGTSPIHVTGMIDSSWFFEGQFPVELRDASGTLVASTVAHSPEDWTKEGKIPFIADIPYPSQKSAKNGFIVLENDNPSGAPENDKSLKIPVTYR